VEERLLVGGAYTPPTLLRGVGVRVRVPPTAGA
jgi:hypothetical protein